MTIPLPLTFSRMSTKASLELYFTPARLHWVLVVTPVGSFSLTFFSPVTESNTAVHVGGRIISRRMFGSVASGYLCRVGGAVSCVCKMRRACGHEVWRARDHEVVVARTVQECVTTRYGEHVNTRWL